MRANNIINYYTFQLKRRGGFARRERNRLNLVALVRNGVPGGRTLGRDRDSTAKRTDTYFDRVIIEIHWLGDTRICKHGRNCGSIRKMLSPENEREIIIKMLRTYCASILPSSETETEEGPFIFRKQNVNPSREIEKAMNKSRRCSIFPSLIVPASPRPLRRPSLRCIRRARTRSDESGKQLGKHSFQNDSLFRRFSCSSPHARVGRQS